MKGESCARVLFFCCRKVIKKVHKYDGLLEFLQKSYLSASPKFGHLKLELDKPAQNPLKPHNNINNFCCRFYVNIPFRLGSR